MGARRDRGGFERVHFQPKTKALPGLALVLAAVAGLLACSAPQPRLAGFSYEYESAKDMFKREKFEMALEFANRPSKAVPPNEYTYRAQALQAVVLSGLIHAQIDLADAYRKGSDAAKNPHYKTAFDKRRADALQAGSKMALKLADLCHWMTEAKELEEEYELDVPYPQREFDADLPHLAVLSRGDWIDTEEQDELERDAYLKGVRDSLESILDLDRSKARTALGGGAVRLNGADLGLFMGQELLYAASNFDGNHAKDPASLKKVCEEAESVSRAVAAALQKSPDSDRSRDLRKLQSGIRATLKSR